MAVFRSEGGKSRWLYCWGRFCLAAGRPLRRAVRLIRWLMLGFVLLFSPLIVWLILAVNRELIHYLVNAPWTDYLAPGAFTTMREDVNSRWFVSGFNEAALGGLLTLYGVIVTVWYYHAVRQQEVIEKRLFVIDELLEELRKNRRTMEWLSGSCAGLSPDENGEKINFYTEAWHKLGADVALLPRVIHLRLSMLYSSLMECGAVDDYHRRKATIDRIPDIISELHKYRRKLSRLEIS